MFRGAFGDLFVDYYLKLKGAELARFQAYVAGNKGIDEADEVTQWEQNEYYDFF
jgi:glutamine synthetase